PYAAGQLGAGTPWLVLGGSLLIGFVGTWLIGAAGEADGFNWVGAIALSAIVHLTLLWGISRLVEGSRKAKDRLVTALVMGAFLLAMLPLLSLVITVLTNGLARFDVEFFTHSMRSVV